MKNKFSYPNVDKKIQPPEQMALDFFTMDSGDAPLSNPVDEEAGIAAQAITARTLCSDENAAKAIVRPSTEREPNKGEVNKVEVKDIESLIVSQEVELEEHLFDIVESVKRQNAARATNTQIQSSTQTTTQFTTQFIHAKQNASDSNFTDLASVSERANAQQTIQVRYSMRAKRMSISINHTGHAEIIVPARKFRKPSLKRIYAFANDNKAWIYTTTQRYQQLAKQADLTTRPTTLSLKYLNKVINIHYQDALNGSARMLKEKGDDLFIASQLTDTEVAEKLGQWLAKQAKQRLLADLAQLAKLYAFQYKKVSIRGQKSRWGSCSAQGNISLNYCILFLPPIEGRYVLIHELCHLQEFNHSKRFWALVESLEPNYKRIDKAIDLAWQNLPHWLDLRFKKNVRDEIIVITI